MSETIRLTPSPFRVSGLLEEYEIETWRCCRDWPIVLASQVWDTAEDRWQRSYWWIRECKLCGFMPRPIP